MPGLFGIARNNNAHPFPLQVPVLMEGLLKYNANFISDKIFTDRNVSAGRCHTNIINREEQPYSKNNISIWFDGEFYNQGELKTHCGLTATTDPALLLELYQKKEFKTFLPRIDGIFSSVIYDAERQLLFLISDRYGLRHLYFSRGNGTIGWSSEIKALTAVPWFNTAIDKEALGRFTRFGYFIQDDTWFTDIKLFPPASFMIFSLADGSTKIENYWSWEQIKPFDNSIDLHSVGEEWGRLFRKAVEKRCHRDEKTGVTLSGGLDSRAILAAFPETHRPIQTATFGTHGCLDIRIAAQAAAVKKARHHVFELSPQNWLSPRLAGVWSTDGQLSILDMHGIECIPEISNIFNISLNGMGGDGIHGGSFMSSKRQQVSTSTDPYGYRGRRFIRVGTMLDEPWMHIRLPFYDNDLLELTLAMPAAIRKNSRFYRIALLAAFPEYFKSIPWQKIEMPLGMPEPVIIASWLMVRIRERLFQRLRSMGWIKKSATHNFADYATWLRNEPERAFIKQLLFTPKAIYPEYFDAAQIRKAWKDHLSGADRSSVICRYIAIEVWLQQILLKNMRPEIH